MNKARSQGVRLLLEGVIAFVLIVLAVARYERELLAINWRLVALLFGVVLLAAAFYRLQTRPDNTYDVVDLLMSNGKADLWKHFSLFFAFLSAWLIVQQALGDKPVETLLVSVLGVFVGKVAIDSVSNAIAGRTSPGDTPPVVAPPPPPPVVAQPPPEHPLG